MVRRLAPWCGAIVQLLSGLSAAAGDVVPLERIRALALASHPVGLEAEALTRLGQAELSAARTFSDPRADVDLGRAKPREGSTEWRSESAWRVTQDFPFPLEYSNRVRAARFEALALDSEGRGRVLELLFQVDVAYFGLAAAAERLALLSESVTDADKVLELASRRVELGEARESERLRSEIELLRQRRALDAARREVEILRGVLRRLAGPGLPEDFEVEARFPAAAAIPAPEELRRRLLDRNPDILAARAEAARAVEARQAAGWGVFPELTAGAFGVNEIDKRTRGFTLGLSVPLWNANRPAIARSRAEESIAAAEYRRLEIDLQSALDRAVRSFRLGADQMERYRSRLLPAARESLRLARFAYEEGETSYLELLDAQRTFREAVGESIDVNRELAVSYAEIRRLTGEMQDDSKE